MRNTILLYFVCLLDPSHLFDLLHLTPSFDVLVQVIVSKFRAIQIIIPPSWILLTNRLVKTTMVDL